MASILLIHGAWHGPWCWENFTRRLTECGHNVRAMRLRGHDRPNGRIWHRVRDYLDDVRCAANEFPDPPVLVGHSLGGLLVQKYLERHPASGGVLLASIPPGGTIAAFARLGARHPATMLKASALLTLEPFVRTRELARELFFTTDTSQKIVDQCFARLQNESYLAFLDTVVKLARPRRVRHRMLVLGAERDGI